MTRLSFFLFAAGLLLTIIACRQDDFLGYWVEVDGQYEYLDIDEPPAFTEGGQEGLGLAILQVLNYPPEARDNGIEGCVKLEYEVTPTGAVENITVITDPGSGLGAAAQAAFVLVTQGQSYSPAILNGQAVRVLLETEVCFSLG